MGENSRLRDCVVENLRLRDCCAEKSRLRDVENRSKNETARRLEISQNFARPLFFERLFATLPYDTHKNLPQIWSRWPRFVVDPAIRHLRLTRTGNRTKYSRSQR